MDPTTPLALPRDPDLLDRLRSGDPGSLESLVRTYWEPLTRYAEGILDGPGGGEDVVQEVFIRLWMRREALGPRGSLRSLLYTMTRNAAIDQRRRERRHAARAAASEPPRGVPSPFESAVAAELARRARRAVAALPPRRREVFRLIREEGLSYEEVASVMGISVQTVANHMSLALASLRAALSPEGVVEPMAGRRVIGG